MNWYDYPITVPFNDPHFDVLYGGSHDLDVGTPPNTPITALLPGTVETITSPSWGKALGIKLDTPYKGIPYMAYLHLSAVAPWVKPGYHIPEEVILGWSGGCNTEAQYAGTSNPTGENFLNTVEQSSQPQTGIALMRGPEYGVGAGWTPSPDPALDPTDILMQARRQPIMALIEQAAQVIWQAVIPGLRFDTGIAHWWLSEYEHGVFHGPALSREIQYVNWQGEHGVVQVFAGGQCEWIQGTPHFYGYR